MNTNALLEERGKVHGHFSEHARATQKLKSILESHPSWERMSDEHKEALHMIVHKVGRIIAGDPHHNDHWDDIAGYAALGSRACIVRPKKS